MFFKISFKDNPFSVGRKICSECA